MFDSCHGRLQLGSLYSDAVVVSCQLVLPGSVYRQPSFLGESRRVPRNGPGEKLLLEIVHFRLLSYDAVYLIYAIPLEGPFTVPYKSNRASRSVGLSWDDCSRLLRLFNSFYDLSLGVSQRNHHM